MSPPGTGKALLADEDLAYVDRARALARRLALSDITDLPGALDALRDVVHMDADVPTSGSGAGATVLKGGIKRLTSWYMAYLAQQANEMGRALVRLGEALAARSERAESANAEAMARIQVLEAAVRRLEEGRRGATGERARGDSAASD